MQAPDIAVIGSVRNTCCNGSAILFKALPKEDWTLGTHTLFEAIRAVFKTLDNLLLAYISQILPKLHAMPKMRRFIWSRNGLVSVLSLL